MSTPSMVPADVVSRSERLDGYLAQDPFNAQLLADAFDAALAAHRLDAAARHVRAGLALGEAGDAWMFRQATFAIASGDLEQARDLLAGLHVSSAHPAVRFNLGYVRFRQGVYAESAELLEPLLDQQPQAQAMWLRSLHQVSEVDRAWAWIEASLSSGRVLGADACGVASLVAFDAEHFAQSAQLAAIALKQSPNHAEALVAQGSMALAGEDAATAANNALTVIRQRDDGRARSLLGFAQLWLRDLPAALVNFEQAVKLMPQHVGTWHGLGWTKLMLKDLDGAAAAFAHALEMDRNFGESHGSYAVVLAMQGRRQEAGFHADRAKRLDPAGMAAQYAELVLSGEGSDAAAVEKLASRLLTALARGRRTQPAGGDSKS